MHCSDAPLYTDEERAVILDLRLEHRVYGIMGSEWVS